MNPETSSTHEARMTFHLPEGEWEFTSAIHGVDYRSAIMDFLEYCRHQAKYGDFPEDIQEAWSAARQGLIDELDARGILHDVL